jgi:hypothetical protein
VYMDMMSGWPYIYVYPCSSQQPRPRSPKRTCHSHVYAYISWVLSMANKLYARSDSLQVVHESWRGQRHEPVLGNDRLAARFILAIDHGS